MAIGEIYITSIDSVLEALKVNYDKGLPDPNKYEHDFYYRPVFASSALLYEDTPDVTTAEVSREERYSKVRMVMHGKEFFAWRRDH